MTFAFPWALLALLIIPLILYNELVRKKNARVTFSSLHLAVQTTPSLRQRLARLPLLLRLVGLILLILALARPQEGIEKVYDVSHGIAIEVVVDRSGSMGAEMEFDGQTLNRLEVVKKVFAEFVNGDGKNLDGRPNDLIGMVTFARFGDTACPLTLAHGAVQELIEHVRLVDRRSEDGTAIGDGIGLAAARLKTAEETLAKQADDKKNADQYEIKSKIIILLTDGANNCGSLSPAEAAELAKKWDIKIYTIGIGRDMNNAANQGFFARLSGRRQQVDTRTLQSLAENTGGIFRMADDGDSLRAIYEEIDRLETSEIESVRYVDYKEYFPPFALIALGLLVLESVLSCTWLRRVP
jgi:Ca-activated chloride channel family protein